MESSPTDRPRHRAPGRPARPLRTARPSRGPRRSGCASTASRPSSRRSPGWRPSSTRRAGPTGPSRTSRRPGCRRCCRTRPRSTPDDDIPDQVIVVPDPPAARLVPRRDRPHRDETQAFLQVTEVSAWVTVLGPRRSSGSTTSPAAGRSGRDGAGSPAGIPSAGPTRRGCSTPPTPADLVPIRTRLVGVPPGRSSGTDPDRPRPERPRPPRPVRHRPGTAAPIAASGRRRVRPERRLVVAPVDRSAPFTGGRPGRGVGLPAAADRRPRSRSRSTSASSCPRTRVRPIPRSIVRATARTRTSGAYAAASALDDVPLGSYVLEAFVDGRVVVGLVARRRDHPQAGLSRCGRHRPPRRHCRATVRRHGRRRPSSTASPCPARRSPCGEDEDTTTRPIRPAPTAEATTDWTARASTRRVPSGRRCGRGPGPARGGRDPCGGRRPRLPERGHAHGRRARSPDAARRDGSVHEVDLARLERELSRCARTYRDVDPNGRPVAGATVTAEITELIPVRRLVGYDYDPITKRVVPRYEYDDRGSTSGTLTPRTRRRRRSDWRSGCPRRPRLRGRPVRRRRRRADERRTIRLPPGRRGTRADAAVLRARSSGRASGISSTGSASRSG